MGDLRKLIVTTGFEWLPKVQKIAQSGHTDAKLGHYRNRQIYFCFQNAYPYSADVKPTINKNWFQFI